MGIKRSIAITEITQSYPEIMDVFSRYGVQIGVDSENINMTLEQMCLEHALDLDEIILELFKTAD